MVSSPDAMPVSTPESLAGDAADIRAGLSWSGRACDLAIADGTIASREMPSIFKGYVIAPSNTAPDKFEIVFAGTHGQRVAATTGVARPAVARHFHAPALARYGLRLGVDFSALPAGSYDIDFHGIEIGRAHD